MADTPQVPWSEMARVFGRIGCLSFGGPAAQIGLMQDELVDRENWISQADFLRAISLCMLLPGPEAMQLATYVGWKLRGAWGGLLAGALFVIPGAIVIFALAGLYLAFGHVSVSQSILLGVQCAVVGILAQALWRMGGRILRSPIAVALALAACAALFAGVPFPLVLAAAAGVGAVAMPITTTPHPATARPVWGPVLAMAALWVLPFAVFAGLGATFLTDIAWVFSKLAVMTFGGAYAVLSYLSQIAVLEASWVTADQMVDALGLAETTPGPLILVTQFVGILAGHGTGGWTLAAASGFVVLWVTFVPCFLWIFLFAPHLEWLTSQKRLAAALQGVSAAVVGIIAQLGLWFFANILFDRDPNLRGMSWDTWDPVALGLMAVAGILLFWRKWSVLAVIPTMAGLGLAVALVS